jgi:hypothetical protein
MDCVNHVGVSATAYCQNCGKALCSGCLRSAAAGQVLCEPCWMAGQSYQQPFGAPPPSGPNPSAAAVLGFIPGVGAMYNGQFFKGFVHVVVFAVLISITEYHGIFGIFIGAWVLYQSFEAYHTAKALREGLAAPDPFGLNEVGNWLNMGTRTRGQQGEPGFGQGPVNPGGYAPFQAQQGQADPSAGPAAAGGQPQYGGQYPPPYQDPYQTPFVPPPVPPRPWRRKEPVGAIVLIGLGLMFLLGQLDVFHGRFMEFAWPLLLIALGVWLIVRRIEESHGGSK